MLESKNIGVEEWRSLQVLTNAELEEYRGLQELKITGVEDCWG